ncbi:hypothetical protein GGF46_002433 [Coemansia sp. RSA 552]|nr:hypothetical protein GGF46_002433 [Coemansia sp. RSA 552]
MARGPAQDPEPAPDMALTQQSARELAEAHQHLATVYARIAGVSASASAKPAPPAREPVRRARDPNRPKRPATAYIIFTQNKRSAIAAEHPEMRPQEVAARLGEAWRNLDEDERERYQARAKVLRDDFFERLDAYKKGLALSAGHDDEDLELDELDESDDGLPATQESVAAVPSTPVKAKAASATKKASAANGHASDTPKKPKKKKTDESGSIKKKTRRVRVDADGVETPKKKKKRSSQASQDADA